MEAPTAREQDLAVLIEWHAGAPRRRGLATRSAREQQRGREEHWPECACPDPALMPTLHPISRHVKPEVVLTTL
jgi:hypothetical protein